MHLTRFDQKLNRDMPINGERRTHASFGEVNSCSQHLQQGIRVGDPVAESAVVCGDVWQSASLLGRHAQTDDLPNALQHICFGCCEELPTKHAPAFHRHSLALCYAVHAIAELCGGCQQVQP
jgi:hypothetical protein